MSFHPHCAKCGHTPPRSDFIFCGQCGSQLVRAGPPLLPVVVGVGAGRVIAVPVIVPQGAPPQGSSRRGGAGATSGQARQEDADG